MVLAQAAPAPAAVPAFRKTAVFAFACRPKAPASASPVYEYRVFLPVQPAPSQMPVRVELSKMDGVSKDRTSLSLERGNLFVFLAPGAEDGSAPMFKVNAFSGSPADAIYDFQMIFTRSRAIDQDGVPTVSISPSEGRLRITRGGVEENFAGECTPIGAGSVQ
jgi:hypothetical protein